MRCPNALYVYAAVTPPLAAVAIRPRLLYVNVALAYERELPAASYAYVRGSDPEIEFTRLRVEAIVYVLGVAPVSVSRLPFASYVQPCVNPVLFALVSRSSESYP